MKIRLIANDSDVNDSTFVEIADEIELNDRETKRYIEYMETLYPRPRIGYYDWDNAKEVATRFKAGTEYKLADHRGQEVLDELYKKY